ncbi:hypothetical protein H4219_002835 [Mycoemilia scoparia]|uniref:Protein kinase domain-containing protein n=1 Tax=Mycoemilia scoparia TaxID=417184 RepID=A0A9W8DTI4_9FUNG|nr:hypothetical protein H4219_002835 [Mycoemilia scoparia]
MNSEINILQRIIENNENVIIRAEYLQTEHQIKCGTELLKGRWVDEDQVEKLLKKLGKQLEINNGYVVIENGVATEHKRNLKYRKYENLNTIETQEYKVKYSLSCFYGKVYFYDGDGCDFVVKGLGKFGDQDDLDTLYREIDVFLAIGGQEHISGIIKMLGVVRNEDGDVIGIALEKGERFVAENITQAQKAELCDGVAYLHSRGYIHCDIKEPNVVIVNEHAKLIDIGSCLAVDDKTSAIFMTEDCGDPKLLTGERGRPGFEFDIYCLCKLFGLDSTKYKTIEDIKKA